MYKTLQDIESFSRLIPFTNTEIQMAMDAVKMRRARQTDLSMGHQTLCPGGDEIINYASRGMLFMHSPVQLQTAFLFTKNDAGRGLFGGQKSVYQSYIDTTLVSEEWSVGTIFKMWSVATTSIGNIYRAAGYK